MPTIPEVLIQIAIGTIPLGVAYLAYRSSSEANRRNALLEYKKVDVAAFDRAQGIYEKGMSQLERQLDRAQAQIAELEISVVVLRAQLIQAGIPPDPRTSTPHTQKEER
jgi:type II secretory pathway component PulJ